MNTHTRRFKRKNGLKYIKQPIRPLHNHSRSNKPKHIRGLELRKQGRNQPPPALNNSYSFKNPSRCVKGDFSITSFHLFFSFDSSPLFALRKTVTIWNLNPNFGSGALTLTINIRVNDLQQHLNTTISSPIHT